LTPGDGERKRDCVAGEKRKEGESSEDAYQSSHNRSNGCGFGDDEPRPGIEEAAHRSVGVADVNIFAAGLRLHGSKFGVGERAEKRKKSAHQPCQIDQLGRTDRLHHFSWNQEYPAADDRAYDYSRSVAYA
jgi:hypothetical protein